MEPMSPELAEQLRELFSPTLPPTKVEEVVDTIELRRIEALERRTAIYEELAPLLTARFTKGLPGSMQLRPKQAQPLADLYDFGAAIGALKVGEGKTPVAFLAPAVVQAECTVLLVDGELRDKTVRHFIELSTDHFDLVPEHYIVSYQELAREQNFKLIDELAPTLIVADECQALRNKKNAATKRVARYLQMHEGKVRLLLLSGTIFDTKSIADYHHLLKWVLGPYRMPLPSTFAECSEWARAIDLSATQPIGIGALRRFAAPEALDAKEDVRKWLGKRLRETPGITITESPDVKASILVRRWVPELDAKLKKALHDAENNILPDKSEIDDDDAQIRTLSQMSWGFYNKPVVRPPEPWLDARRAWWYFVRNVKESGQFDTEFQIRNNAAKGTFGYVKEYHDWLEIAPTFKLETEVVWISDCVMNQVAVHYGEGHIIWAENTAVGNLLESRGFDYYHELCLNARGEHIENAKFGRSIIASRKSCYKGVNLQYVWSKNLVLSHISKNEIIEQLIGRTHRKGQKADRVDVTWGTPTGRYKYALEAARMEAKDCEHRTGVQKLTLADFAD
jgi:hypothetical protein